jgi:hypothetical protein
MFTSFLHGQDTHLHAPHIYTQHTRAIQKPLSPTSLPLHDISQENEKDILLITNTKLHKKESIITPMHIFHLRILVTICYHHLHQRAIYCDPIGFLYYVS